MLNAYLWIPIAPQAPPARPPGYHADPQRLVDDAKPSKNTQSKEVKAWVSELQSWEAILNQTTALVAPLQHQAGVEAQEEILIDEKGVLTESMKNTIRNWPSVFTGISVISNRITPPHRDKGGAVYDFDVLASTGTHTRATIQILDTGLTFAYGPGVVVILLGKLLQHAVPSWKGGERVCYAHFMKDNVLRRYSKTERTWVNLQDFS
ncbi:hypothetical protein SCHPADRAFT_1002187 [Schizopora paradoxa]|uniref:2OGFeDO JBP1/TET oxygenase domain-containing protein n=1 Tax=Schizopora paradoxa TaxID=27342 RepID=A0A0H2RB29_9AGAM|nr:hypothetical protein SCHPADRAFT_1002187 [Schizopora paradoxa]